MKQRVAWVSALALALAVVVVVGAGCKGKDKAPGAGAGSAIVADSAGVSAGPSIDAANPATIDAAAAAAIDDPSLAPVEARRVWTNAIRNEADMMAYSVEIGGERFTKFVLDTKTDAIYYFDVDLYKIHKDFIFGELIKQPRSKQLVREVDRNYGYTKPAFMMCYLVHHLASDVWTMAFWEGDKARAPDITRAFNRMRETFYLGDKVSYRPDSDYQEAIARGLTIPVLTNDKLYKSATYQAFNPGKAVGVLRLVPAGADFEELTFEPDEIVILPESIPDITPVAGIVSETFSTPLAHVSLRARAWGIPNVGLRGAATTYAALVGKTVVFEATAAGHTLREATPDEIAAWQARTRQAREVLIPTADLAARELRGLDGLRAAEATAYGAKSANLGEIVHGKLTGFVVPPGFGIPIAYYDDHLKAAGLDQQIAALLADPKFRKNAAYRKQALDALRKSIAAAPLDPAFRELLAKRYGELTGGDLTRGVFVRSSTNAEDLPGFSGAGLYDTIPNAKGVDAVAQAVKDVWASVWTLRGYEERELYKIDHTKVYGAVLVQIGVNATAAGVLVTAHPSDPAQKTTYTINAKSGLGLRVVQGQKVPESLLYDVHNHGLRILSRSDEDTMLVFDGKGGVREVPNPQKGKPVITQARARILGDAARKITTLFPPDRPLDIEWLFVGEELNIVQARPYVVR